MKVFFSLFLVGLSFGAGPCLASCGPVLVSYIGASHKNIRESLIAYFLFSLSRIFVYILLGLGIFFLGNFIAQGWFRGLSSGLFIIAGAFIILLGILTALGRAVGFPGLFQGHKLLQSYIQFLQQQVVKQDKKSIITLGIIFGILPCAPLIALLGYMGLIGKNWAQVLFYCFSFGLGTVFSPLIILSGLAGLIPRFLAGQKENYSRVLSFICGAIMVIMGLQLAFKAG